MSHSGSHRTAVEQSRTAWGRSWLFCAVILAMGLSRGASVATAASPATKPNIVLILADDFGYECVGADGGTSYRTPALDSLAASGARFDQCYVQPLCTPTRLQLMTGLYNVRNYTTFGEMDPNAVTFGQLLKSAGYATCIAGKWQLGRDINLPRKFGFDEHYLWQHLRRPPRYANPGLEINGVEKDYSGGKYGPDLVNEYALDFIDRHKDRPFFLYYPMMLTHAPLQPTPDSPDWDPNAEGESVKQSPRHFGEMTHFMDKLVGKVVARLEQHKLRERTLVLFVGDNGTGKNHRSKMGSRDVIGGKGTTTPEGMHVPLIANWPGTVAPHVCTDLVDSTDFLPTVCEVAGVTPPRIDGRSFLPQLRGERGNPRDWCYCWYSPRREPPEEFTFDVDYRLNRDGSFQRFEKNARPLAREMLDAQGRAALQKLEAGLRLFKDARPAGIDQTPRNKSRRGRAQDE